MRKEFLNYNLKPKYVEVLVVFSEVRSVLCKYKQA